MILVQSPLLLFLNVFFPPGQPENMGVTFRLYTRPYDEDEVEVISTVSDQKTEEGLKNSKCKYGKKTTFLINGFSVSYDSDWIRNMTSALLQKEDMNLIVVDWDEAAKGPLSRYPVAARNALIVGKILGKFINLLKKECQVDFSDVHLIGISLGAQLAASAGKETEEKIGWISGLDPARPLFTTPFSLSIRLDKSKADFVDVIHTDGGTECAESKSLCSERFGFSYGALGSLGHADFYPNGGKHQPGCAEENIYGIDTCSHFRVAFLYLSSIDPTCDFVSCNTEDLTDCVSMGYNVNKSARGDYYLTTSGTYPYC